MRSDTITMEKEIMELTSEIASLKEKLKIAEEALENICGDFYIVKDGTAFRDFQGAENCARNALTAIRGRKELEK